MCTVGYGDFSPTTATEQLFVTACMLISAGIYALTIENVDKIISKHNVNAGQFREHMLYVNQFMKRNLFPLELRSQIWRYLQYQWETKKQIKIEHGEVFGLLNYDL
jgi:Ion channel